MFKEVHIKLDAEDFKTLINGGVVVRDNAKIILADIGFDVMQLLLMQAYEGK